jgi:glutamate decarboxylase
VVAFALDGEDRNYTVFDVADRVREQGWLVPAYTFPENRQDLAVLRVVVRNGFSLDLADLLVGDLRRDIAYLDQLAGPLPDAGKHPGFHH